MSVRKLTNVQKARRMLRARIQRCASDAFIIPSASSWGERSQSPWTWRQIVHAVRHLQPGEVQRYALRQVKGRNTWHEATGWAPLTAARMRDGSIKFNVGGFSTYYPLPVHHQEAIEFRRRRQGVIVARPTAACGPCTEKELVAIDTLLERGDKYAERLAKSCKRGGGVLEGASPRKKRKR